VTVASQPLCAQCGLLIDAYYVTRARWALSVGAVAVGVTTLVAWMAHASEYHALSRSRTMQPSEEVFADVRVALGAATCLALLLIGAAVWTRRNTLQAAIVTTLVVPAAAVLTIALAPYYYTWTDDLVMAPIGWTVALAGAATAWFWAHRASDVARADDATRAGEPF
jgi:hypothetical protein